MEGILSIKSKDINAKVGMSINGVLSEAWASLPYAASNVRVSPSLLAYIESFLKEKRQ